MDKLTNFVLGALRFLFIGNPYRTSLGLILGLALYALIQIFNPLIKSVAEGYIDFSLLTQLNCIFLSLVLIYFPALVSFIGSPKKELLNEDLEKVLRLIRLAVDEAAISKTQKRHLYFKICEKAVEQVTFKPSTQKELEKEQILLGIQEEEQKE